MTSLRSHGCWLLSVRLPAAAAVAAHVAGRMVELAAAEPRAAVGPDGLLVLAKLASHGKITMADLKPAPAPLPPKEESKPANSAAPTNDELRKRHTHLQRMSSTKMNQLHLDFAQFGETHFVLRGPAKMRMCAVRMFCGVACCRVLLLSVLLAVVFSRV